MPDYLIKGGNTYRIVTDPLGSPRFVLNAADGTVAQQLDYDEFGRVLQDTNPGFQPFGFAGGLYDRDTGLVRFGARDYDPDTGRWTAKDPLLFGGRNTRLYAYVGNNPLKWVDSLGLSSETAGGQPQPYFPSPFDVFIPGTPANKAFVDTTTKVLDSIYNMANGNRPPGFWPGDKGAAEWGRRNDLGAREGKGRFHGIKQGCPGSKATNDYGVNPNTGDVVDPEGEIVGNLNDVKSK